MTSFKSFYRTILVAGVALAAALGVSSAAYAVTYTGGAGTQDDPSWSVTVDPGITLIESVLQRAPRVQPIKVTTQESYLIGFGMPPVSPAPSLSQMDK